jgi:hypothetical protein
MTQKVKPSTLADTAVTPGTYGGGANVAVIVVDQQGRVTSAANATPSLSFNASSIVGYVNALQIANNQTYSINISGSAGSATSASTVPWSGISSKPTTASAFGITDAITTGNIGSQSVSYASTAGSVSGAVSTSGSYSNPSWITSLSASKITGVHPSISVGSTSSEWDASGSLISGYARNNVYGGIAWGCYASSTNQNGLAVVVSSTTSNMVGLYYGTPGSVTTVGMINTTGTGVVYLTSSDRRLKKNIKDIEKGSSGIIIDKLKPREFVWNSTNEKAIGFIADEVETVLPDCVSGTKDEVDNNGEPRYQGVDMSSPTMMATIIQELQELRKRVKELESKAGI